MKRRRSRRAERRNETSECLLCSFTHIFAQKLSHMHACSIVVVFCVTDGSMTAGYRASTSQAPPAEARERDPNDPNSSLILNYSYLKNTNSRNY